MARSFPAGNGPRIQVAAGALTTMPFGTYVAVVQREAGGSDLNFVFNAGTSQSAGLCLDVTNDKLTVFWNLSQVAANTLTLTSAEGWALIAVTKPTGTAAPRFHKYVYRTDTWYHENSATTVSNVADTFSTAFIGAFSAASNRWVGDIAALAAYRSVVLTDSQIESMAFSLSAWTALAPTAMWVLDQATTAQAVRDWTGGGAQQSATSGTLVSANSAPIGSYGHPVLLATRTAAATGPTNDNIANATVLAGGTTQVTGNNSGGSCQSGEPLASGSGTATSALGAGSPGYNTVWFRWTAPSSAAAQIDCIGTSFDSYLTIFRANNGVADPVTAFTDLTCVASDDDSGGNGTSMCVFTPVAGVSYYIQLRTFSFSGAGGAYTLNYPLPAAGGPAAQSGAAALSAASSLTAAASAGRPGAAALSAASALNAAAASAGTQNGAAALTAASSLTAGASTTQPGAVTMTAGSGLTVAAVRVQSGAVAMTATSGLSTTGTVTQPGAVTMTSASGLTATATTGTSAAAAMTASSSLTAAGSVTAVGTVAMTASGALTATASRGQSAASAMSAASGLTADTSGGASGAAGLTAQSGLTVTATGVGAGVAAMTAVSSLTAATARTVLGAGPMTAASNLTTAGQTTTTGTSAMTATSSLTAASTLAPGGGVALTAQSGLTADGRLTTAAAVVMSAQSLLTANAGGTATGASAMTAQSSLTVAAVRQTNAAAVLTALSALSAAATAGGGSTLTLTASSGLTAAATSGGRGAVSLTAISQLVAGLQAALTASVAMTAQTNLGVVITAIRKPGLLTAGSTRTAPTAGTTPYPRLTAGTIRGPSNTSGGGS